MNAYHLPTQCCGYIGQKAQDYPVMWNSGNGVVQCHNCGHVYVPQPSPDAHETLRRAYSREELSSSMAEWMVKTFGHPMEITDTARERWLRDNGMIHQFIRDHFPAE